MQPLTFLLSKTRITFCIVVLFLSCNNNFKENPFTKNIKSICGNAFTDSTKAIFIIDDQACPSCNKKFALFCKQFLNSKNTIVIVTAHPSSLDLSDYIENTHENVFFDKQQLFIQSELVRISTAILYTNKQIDTILPMDATILESNIDFVTNKLN